MGFFSRLLCPFSKGEKVIFKKIKRVNTNLKDADGGIIPQEYKWVIWDVWDIVTSEVVLIMRKDVKKAFVVNTSLLERPLYNTWKEYYKNKGMLYKKGDHVTFTADARVAPKAVCDGLTSHESDQVWEVAEDMNDYYVMISPIQNNTNSRKTLKVAADWLKRKNNQSTSKANNNISGYKAGDTVKFRPEVQSYYDGKSGAKIPMTESIRNAVWKIEKVDPGNYKFYYLNGENESSIKAKYTQLEPYFENSEHNTSDSNFDTSSTQDPAKNKGEPMIKGKDYNGYQFTALGLSGSGKTCFMAGMYYKMTGGVSGYTLKADDDDSVSLTAYYEQMENADMGADRFPGGTNQSTDYAFELQYGYKTLEKFRWIDYAGGTLKSKNSGDAEEYQKLKDDISKSEMLYIFVDGALFQDEELEYASTDSEKIDLLTDVVMSSSARQINHFLSEYTSERHKLPPIAIVITKYDLAVKALGKASGAENMEMLYKIIHRAFNPLFPDPSMYVGDDGHTSIVGIIPVSLGMKISENNYSGRLRPINMHLPAYVGIWFMLKNSVSKNDTSIKKLADEIEDSGIKFWLNGQMGKFSTLAEGYLKKVKENS